MVQQEIMGHGGGWRWGVDKIGLYQQWHWFGQGGGHGFVMDRMGEGVVVTVPWFS